MIRSLLLYTTEPVLAVGIQSLLETRGVHKFDSYANLEAITAVARNYDLVVLNLENAELNIETIGGIAALAKTILRLNNPDGVFITQSIANGVRGIIQRTSSTEEFLDCLQSIDSGSLFFEKVLTDCIARNTFARFSFSNREGQLIWLLAGGRKNKEIANCLKISEGTVKVYLSRLFQKANVKDRFELAVAARRNGYQPEPEAGEAIPSIRSLTIPSKPDIHIARMRKSA